MPQPHNGLGIVLAQSGDFPLPKPSSVKPSAFFRITAKLTATWRAFSISSTT